MKNRRFVAARRLGLVAMSVCALVGVATPAYATADTAGPTVTIDPALHFTKGGPYDWYANGDMTYLVSAEWHMSDAGKICDVSGTMTAYYGDEEFFGGDANRTSYAVEYSGYGKRRTNVTLSVTDCAGNTTTASKLLTAGVVQDDPTAVYSKTWRTGTCFHEGCWMYSTIHKTYQPGATASFKVTGNAFALITDNRGTFDVYFDGTRVAQVVAGQSSVSNGHLNWVTYRMTRATHTITVVARSGRVDVDGVFVS